MAPQHGSSGGALVSAHLGRLLRVARVPVRADAEIGLASSAGRQINAMRMRSAIGGDGAKHGAREFADQLGLGS
jgi:hypothetical protein